MASHGDLAIHGGRPVRAEYLPFGKPSIGQEEIDAVSNVLRSGWIGQGRVVEEFESRFAAIVGAGHAVAVSSCTAALHLSLVASGVGVGDEVLVPTLTFAATATSVQHAGAEPVFCDIDPSTLSIDLGDAAKRINQRTKAVVVVHFAGLPLDMDELEAFATLHGLAVIEDAAHALGARYGEKPIGSFNTLCCFSFYANKNITTGEGGMITTPDAHTAERLRVLRLHGLSSDAWKRYADPGLVFNELDHLGFKCNLTDLQASLGLQQLAKLDAFQRRRKELASRYDDAFRELAGVTFQARSLRGRGVEHALHLYLLLLCPGAFAATRDEIVAALRAENIGASIHYRALHLEPYYRRRYGYLPETFPNALEVSERVMTLPLSPSMSDDDAADVVRATMKVLSFFAN